MEINIKNNLPLDILFLIRIKANEFKNEGIHEGSTKYSFNK